MNEALGGEIRNAQIISAGNREEQRLLGKHSHRWEDNIKIYHKEIVSEVVDCINVAQVVRVCKDGN